MAKKIKNKIKEAKWLTKLRWSLFTLSMVAILICISAVVFGFGDGSINGIIALATLMAGLGTKALCYNKERKQ